MKRLLLLVVMLLLSGCRVYMAGYVDDWSDVVTGEGDIDPFSGYGTGDVDQVLEQMSGSGSPLNLVILDACRNNPFERRFRGVAGGLAQIDAPKGAP